MFRYEIKVPRYHVCIAITTVISSSEVEFSKSYMCGFMRFNAQFIQI